MINLNWEEQWQQGYDRRTSMYADVVGLGYWDARARDFSQMRVSNQYEYGRKVLAILDPLLCDKAEVLDVGAGPGTFLVPFAPKVYQFTAVEPAVNMVAMLRENAESAGISNYQVLQTPWQEIDVDRFQNRFDLVTISISLWMFRDVWQQIQRLEQVCRGYCCVVTGVDHEPNKKEPSLWKAIMGDTSKPSYSEFPTIFNLLYAKGRLPEVRTFSHTAERSVENRIRQQKLFFSKYIDLTPSHEKIIQDVVKKAGNNGKVLETYTTAAIWWKP